MAGFLKMAGVEISFINNAWTLCIALLSLQERAACCVQRRNFGPESVEVGGYQTLHRSPPLLLNIHSVTVYEPNNNDD